MTDSASGPRPRRLTARGAATKARIIEAADQLMYERGVASTTLADVRASSGTSKSQLYQHFAEKDAMVCQWPVGLPCGRSRDLLVDGHVMSLLVAS